jgi:hypothetical protein
MSEGKGVTGGFIDSSQLAASQARRYHLEGANPGLMNVSMKKDLPSLEKPERPVL